MSNFVTLKAGALLFNTGYNGQVFRRRSVLSFEKNASLIPKNDVTDRRLDYSNNQLKAVELTFNLFTV